MANITAAGINNIEDINGCHINPEQSRISNAEHGSTYRLLLILQFEGYLVQNETKIGLVE